MRARHESIKGEEDEMRDDIEAMMRETVKLGDLDMHTRLDETITILPRAHAALASRRDHRRRARAVLATAGHVDPSDGGPLGMP